MKKKILITGSTGFLGKNILNFLIKKNFKIYDVLRLNKKKTIKKKNNYIPIFFNNLENLSILLKKINPNVIIHCATHYTLNNDTESINKIINANISFGTVLLEAFKKKKIIFINFGSMMEHSIKNLDIPENFYALTKNIFYRIQNYYSINNSKIKFYNLKLFDTYGLNDNRKKLIPTIIQNYKNRKTTFIKPGNLRLNLINCNNINNIIEKIIKKKLRFGTYIIKNKNFTIIKELIKRVNRKLKKKIKIKFIGYKKIEQKKILFPCINIAEKQNDIQNFLIKNL
jgi:CDP-3, 6-dideoxy-D-glycero-L-glycero-4-hexulose-4-reductase